MHDMHYLTGLVVLIMFTICYGGDIIADKEEIRGITKEILSWTNAPKIDHFITLSEVHNPSETIFTIKYKASNGEICEGQYNETKLENKKKQKSHTFECYKEEIQRRRIYHVLDKDDELFPEGDHKNDLILPHRRDKMQDTDKNNTVDLAKNYYYRRRLHRHKRT